MISDIDSVRISFGRDYCEIMGLIAYLNISNKVNILFPYGDKIFLKI